MFGSRGNDVKRNLGPLLFLSTLYMLVSIIGEDLLVSPINSPAEFRLGIMVPAATSIIFGPIIGGLSAGIGNLLIDIWKRLFSISSTPFGIKNVIGFAGNFFGGWITGILVPSGTERKGPRTKKEFFSIKTIYSYFIETISAVTGLALVTGFIIGYGIGLYKGDSFSEMLSIGTPIFLSIFFANTIVLIILTPVTLVFYDAFRLIAEKIGEKKVKRYQTIDLEIEREGYAKITKVWLPEDVLTSGKSVPIKISFSNNSNAKRRFNIEFVATAKHFPHIDNTDVLEPGENWVQTFYISPLKQEEVTMRIKISPSTTKKFKEPITNETVATLKAQVLSSQDPTLTNLLQFSAVILSVFSISITWNNILMIIQNGFQFEGVQERWKLIGSTILFELILFVPFLFLMVYFQPKTEKAEKIELAFSDDLESHIYEKSLKRKQKAIKLIYYYLFSVIQAVLLVFMIIVGFFFARDGWKTYFGRSIEFSYETYFYLTLVLIFLGILILKIGRTYLTEIKSEIVVKKKEKQYIKEFIPLTSLVEGKPTFVIVKVQNLNRTKGLRIIFEGYDVISPKMVELHLKQNETALFKISITPIEAGTRNLTAIYYPLFDKDGNYIDVDVAEPMTCSQLSLRFKFPSCILIST